MRRICPLLASLLLCGMLAACGSDEPRGPGTFGAIEGTIDGVSFPVAYAGVGNLWVVDPENGATRFGQQVTLSDLPGLCELLPGEDPPEVHALLFFFYDTEPGTYAVVEDPQDSDIGTRVAEAYLTGRQNDQDQQKRHAVSGEVILESIAPSNNEPLAEGSVARGSFSLTFLKNAPVTLECIGSCTADGCSSTCSCERPDGTTFECTPAAGETSCCTEGITETETVTGRFEAPFCFYQCACLGDPCPCFEGAAAHGAVAPGIVVRSPASPANTSLTGPRLVRQLLPTRSSSGDHAGPHGPHEAECAEPE